MIVYGGAYTLSTAQSMIGLELLGNGGFGSLNYMRDLNLEEGKKNYFSYRVGIGVDPFDNGINESFSLFLPLSIHYTLWNHLEVGLGLTPYTHDVRSVENGQLKTKTEIRTILFPSLGYRTNLGRQWVFRANFTPIHSLHQDADEWLIPWIGIMFARKIGAGK